MRYYVFAKFFQHLSVDELMRHCAEAQLDGPTALIRDGYWIEEKKLNKQLSHFIHVAQTHQLNVEYADSSFDMVELSHDPTPLNILADNGIRYVRLGYVSKQGDVPVRHLSTHVQKYVEKLAQAAEHAKIKVIIQLHGGCYPHNATAAYPIVRNLNPEWIGIKIDPGNNIHQEGFEYWHYQFDLLDEYIAAVGMKDACSLRKENNSGPTKGWYKEFVPAYEGETNWHSFYKLLHALHRDIPLVLMPFYHTEDFSVLYDKMQQEIAYFKKMEAETKI